MTTTHDLGSRSVLFVVHAAPRRSRWWWTLVAVLAVVGGWVAGLG